jgi:hypothetical protein
LADAAQVETPPMQTPVVLEVAPPGPASVPAYETEVWPQASALFPAQESE